MKNGFTLIELLAVIVILSIVLLISVPMLQSLLTAVNKNVFVADAKMVLKALELEESINNLDVTTVNEANIKNYVDVEISKYSKLKVTKTSGKIEILLIGNDKLAGSYVAGDKTDLKVKDLPSEINLNLSNLTVNNNVSNRDYPQTLNPFFSAGIYSYQVDNLSSAGRNGCGNRVCYIDVVTETISSDLVDVYINGEKIKNYRTESPAGEIKTYDYVIEVKSQLDDSSVTYNLSINKTAP